jgi:hypothetical protein
MRDEIAKKKKQSRREENSKNCNDKNDDQIQ